MTAIKYTPLPTPVPEVGQTVEVTRIDTDGVFPCRRCQDTAAPGDKLRLISYNPFVSEANNSPYVGSGPIFVHAKECTPYSGSKLSESHLARGWPFSLRAYDEKHMIAEACLAECEDVDRKAEELLGMEGIQYVHGHHGRHGCFAFKVEKA